MRHLLLPLILAACAPAGDTDVIDEDADGSPADVDCDDADPDIHPGADEVCDGVDQDCDGQIDEEALDAQESWADADGDGFGAGDGVTSCEPPLGYVADDTDCDDTNAEVHPGADELCDPLDRDCDGSPTDGALDTRTVYVDADGDGSPGTEGGAECALPPDGSWEPLDCDDADPDVHPGAEEICDLVDQDCDGGLGFPIVVGVHEASVQEAVDAAWDGDSVCIPDGVWDPFTLTSRRITVVGGPGHEIDVRGGPVRILGGAVTVEGLTVADVTTQGLLVRGGEHTLRDLHVSGGDIGSGEQVGAVRIESAVVEVAGLKIDRVAVGNEQAGTLFEASLSDVVLRDLDVSKVTVNVSVRPGALIHGTRSTVEGERWRVEGVSAADLLWGIAGFDASTARISDYQVRDTSGGISGRLVFASDSDITLEDALLAGGRGDAFGGAVNLNSGTLDVTRLRIVDNDVLTTEWFYLVHDVRDASLQNVIVAGNTAPRWMFHVDGGDTQHLELSNATLLDHDTQIVAHYGGTSVLTNVLSRQYSEPVWGIRGDGGLTSTIRYSIMPNAILRSYYLFEYVEDLEVTFESTSEPLAEDWDLHPIAGSPTEDAGDPEILDPDGTRSDIGAYGGPGAAGW